MPWQVLLFLFYVAGLVIVIAGVAFVNWVYNVRERHEQRKLHPDD